MASSIPDFPDILPDQPENVLEAYDEVRSTWERGRRILRQEDCDPVWLLAVAGQLTDYDDLLEAVLAAVVKEVDNEAWATELAKAIVGLIDALRRYAHVMSARCVYSHPF